MLPRLIVVSGPRQGSVLELTEKEISVGRAPDNALCLPVRQVSRSHCVVRADEDRYVLVDLGSKFGTFVNGCPVRERTLEHGDRIRVIDTELVFATLPDPPIVDVLTDRLEPGTFVDLLPTEAFYPVGDDRGRKLRDLETLYETARSLGAIRDLEGLVARLLQLTLDAVPADRAAVVLLGKNPEEIEATRVLDKRRGFSRSGQVSRTITRRVVEGGVAVLSNDVRQTDSLLAESVLASGVRAVLCVPLGAPGRVFGVLHLQTSEPEGRFDEDDLKLASAVGGIASVALENARHVAWLEGETKRLRQDPSPKDGIVGESAAMREVAALVAKVAPTDATILIHGETGTGKELVARALHAGSPRSGRALVAINCAALPETLLESELFGHERGAFTGAIAQKKGKIELADGGTLFLDEIGDLSPALQGKLLRVLQEREFERVGGTRTLKVDLRLVAATHRDLGPMEKEGTFRADLRYRLQVVSLRLPRLRDRREDIPLLASHFVARSAEKYGRRMVGITPDALARLSAYDWPGNVRELENAVERAVVLGSDDLLRPEDLPEALLEGPAPARAAASPYHDAVRETKRRLILEAIERAEGKIAEAARQLDVHPNYLHRLITNLDLRKDLKRLE
jgi:Nif-specific regulatory protein